MLITCITAEIQKALCNPGPDLVVCDEGHRIKNDYSNISQALKRIRTRYVCTCRYGCMYVGSVESEYSGHCVRLFCWTLSCRENMNILLDAILQREYFVRHCPTQN